MVDMPRGRIIPHFFKQKDPVMQKQAEDARKSLDRAEIWKAQSHTELAKEIISACREIENDTFEQISRVLQGSLDKYIENPTALVAFIVGGQQRLATIRLLLNMFIPSEAEIQSLLSQVEE